MEAIAKASDGSFRDASKLLEVAALQQGRKKIIKDTITRIAGNIIHGDDFIRFIKKKDAKEALAWLNDSVEKGLNIKFWLEDLLAGLHNRLLLYYAVESGPVASELETFDEEEVKRLIMLFTRAHQELRTAIIPQLSVELAIIEYCTKKDLRSNI